MSESPSSSVPSAILSPVGGAIIGALFFPLGCNEYVDVLECAADQKTNILGSTMGGFVGNVDQAGAFVIGVIVAGLIYLGLSLYESSQQSGDRRQM